jgi:hypothetical protein
MPEQITINTDAIYAWCLFIAAVCVAAVWLWKAIKPMFKPFKDMQHELEEIEKRGHVHDERFRKGEDRMGRHDKMLEEIQADNKIMMESLALLLSHAETGNNTGEVAKGRRKLESYLINK